MSLIPQYLVGLELGCFQGAIANLRLSHLGGWADETRSKCRSPFILNESGNAEKTPRNRVCIQVRCNNRCPRDSSLIS
ncbi:MAG: hypothetical protein LH628_03170 [Microcoleus sp. CAN_BIN18]|nr:hypothetical protein [Microcoleus sp. CAN_BIN18]